MIIHKQRLSPTSTGNEQIKVLPKGAKLLTVQNQTDTITFWYLFNEKETKTISKKFYVVFTGVAFKLPATAVFFGTVTIDGLVYHIFAGK